MTRIKVTPIEMGRIVAQFLGGDSKRLPRLTEEQATFLQARYEVIQERPAADIRTPPATIPAQVKKKPNPPTFFIDGDGGKTKH